ncbi:MAG: hypothetical protein K2X27_18885 [Candidatus Obscuribacterales bacterium]|nr:hypothetical protein [Candidatus Obscuribacterales bacterium]
MKSTRTGRLPQAATLMLLALPIFLLSGCREDNKDKSQSVPNNTVNTVESKTKAETRKESIELLPDNVLRRHVFNEFNQEIETHTKSGNGETLSIYRRQDGSVQESTVTDKNGKIKQRKVFARDGKTVVAGLETRSDGTLLWNAEQNKDGSIQKSTYWYDGKRLFSTEITRPDGSIEQSFYRKSGKLWQRKSGPDAQHLKTEQYDRDGKLSYSYRTLSDGIIELCRFDEKGNLTMRVTYRVNSSPYGYSDWTAISAEEIGADGKSVTRKITLSGYGSVDKIETYNQDGTVTVRTLKYGYVDSEEVLDKNGKSISQRQFNYDDRPNESIDRSQFSRPYPDDPARSWQNQESYPYYRNMDD